MVITEYLVAIWFLGALIFAWFSGRNLAGGGGSSNVPSGVLVGFVVLFCLVWPFTLVIGLIFGARTKK